MSVSFLFPKIVTFKWFVRLVGINQKTGFLLSTILKVENLTKKFGYLTAVKNLSFTIEKGNVYGILGPNGSGKSTTLGIILNVVNRTSGDFSWF